MSEILTQLLGTYETEGWKHIENWLNQMIQACISEIMSPTTPKEEVDTLRAQAYAYQSILDKVEADKENYKTSLQG